MNEYVLLKVYTNYRSAGCYGDHLLVDRCLLGFWRNTAYKSAVPDHYFS